VLSFFPHLWPHGKHRTHVFRNFNTFFCMVQRRDGTEHPCTFYNSCYQLLPAFTNVHKKIVLPHYIHFTAPALASVLRSVLEGDWQ